MRRGSLEAGRGLVYLAVEFPGEKCIKVTGAKTFCLGGPGNAIIDQSSASQGRVRSVGLFKRCLPWSFI
jgi:hypothetical protein